MNRVTTIILVFMAFIIAGLLAFRFYKGRVQNAWICKDGQWVKQGEPKEPMPTGPCEEGEKVVEGKPEEQKPEEVKPEEEKEETPAADKFEKSKQIADQAAKNSPTYKFDGFDLKYESFQTLRCPNCWEFTFSFNSRHAGYGDRKGQILAQVVTPHRIRVTVQDEKVASVVTDRTFDELRRIFLK